MGVFGEPNKDEYMKIIYFTTALKKEDYVAFSSAWESLNTSIQNLHNRLIRALALTHQVEVISIRPFSRKYCKLKKLEVENKTEGKISWHYVGIRRLKISRYLSVKAQCKKIMNNIELNDAIVITDTLKDSSGSPIHDQDNNIQIDTLTFFPTSNNQVPFNGSAYRKLNVGGTIGIGSLFRFNISNYYILIKFDVSANMNALMTLKQGQIINNDFNHLRYSADAHATLTFMLPIKKPLQDACIRWGKYK